MMNNEELKEFRLMLGLTCQEAGDLMYLMELCYKKYLEDHKKEVEERINNRTNLYFRLVES